LILLLHKNILLHQKNQSGKYVLAYAGEMKGKGRVENMCTLMLVKGKGRLSGRGRRANNRGGERVSGDREFALIWRKQATPSHLQKRKR
jgi:hypothetical protein